MSWGERLQTLSTNKWFLLANISGTIISVVSFVIPLPKFVYDYQIQGAFVGACSLAVVLYLIGLSKNNWYPYKKWCLGIYRRLLLFRSIVLVDYTRITTGKEPEYSTVHCKIGEDTRFIYRKDDEQQWVTLVFSIPIGYELELAPTSNYIDLPDLSRKEKISKGIITYVYLFDPQRKYSPTWSISIHNQPW